MKQTCLALVAIGIASLVASFIWPHLDDGRGAWTEEKAKAYSEVSSRSHALATKLGTRGATEEDMRLAEQADAEFRAMKAELDYARTRGDRVGFWLKIIGGVLAGVGGVGFLAARDPN